MEELPGFKTLKRTAIIPHCARPSVVHTVESLLETRLINRVIIVTSEISSYLERFQRRPNISLVKYESNRFCKASMLNRGLSLINDGLVLMSDADIIWSTEGLTDVVLAIEKDHIDFAWVNKVVESGETKVNQAALHRRLGFRVTHTAPDEALIELFEDQGSETERPGYGILCGMRSSFESVGGYKSGWGGAWGWEDVDILLRAELLGLKLEARGKAIHLTHDDTLRALKGMSKSESRNRNIILSKIDISEGRLFGGLHQGNPTRNINVIWRDTFHH